ncbi:MAG: glycosyltransferase [Devosia sp.]|nr:glycosyltransferase [Devosia sp.]
MTPLVSVILPSFNHERFVAEAISSVLSQSYGNLELIIVDDASQDGSPAIIQGCSDPRIRSFLLTENVGGAAALNAGVREATGAFVAICNSDDIWEPGKLEQQVAIMEAQPGLGACFSDVSWIDEGGEPLDTDQAALLQTFTESNRSRQQWMKRLIERGNRLCHSSALVRRQAYTRLGPYCDWLRQVPDLHMWLRLLAQYEIFVSPERLVRFRWHSGNTSAPTPPVVRRAANEMSLVLKQFFEAISPADFVEAFGTGTPLPDSARASFRLEQARYLMDATGPQGNMLRQLGWEFFFDVVGSLPWSEQLDRADILAPSQFQSRLAQTCVWTAPPPPPSPPQLEPPVPERAVSGPPVSEITTLELVRTIGRRLMSRRSRQ